jgi:hypothetical protein
VIANHRYHAMPRVCCHRIAIAIAIAIVITIAIDIDIAIAAGEGFRGAARGQH